MTDGMNGMKTRDFGSECFSRRAPSGCLGKLPSAFTLGNLMLDGGIMSSSRTEGKLSNSIQG